MKKLTAKFGKTIVQEKVGYCNRNVVSVLKEAGINWKMDIMSIEFCGKRFPLSSIENGKAEEFAKKMTANGQTSLERWL